MPTMDCLRGLLFLPPLLLVACSPAPGPVLTVRSEGEGSELGAAEVRRGTDRGTVEWHLLADAAGEEALVETMTERFHFERLHSDADLERILAKEFPHAGGKDQARVLWRRHGSASFSTLEADNRTIVFFDSAGKAVEAWPRLADLRG